MIIFRVLRFPIKPFLLLFCFFCSTHLAHALSIEPLIVEMEASGSGNRATLHIKNNTSQPVPIELTARRISLDRDGNRIEIGGGDDILIIPDQALVPANTVQSIRLQFIGAPDISETRTYIVLAEQLPVALGEETSGIQVVMSYSVAVNVSPAGSTGRLEVIATEITQHEGKRLARVTLRNSGTRHVFVSDGNVRLSAGNWSADLNKSAMQKTMGLGLLLPGKERVFLLDAQIPDSVTQYTAEFSSLNTN